MDLTLDGVGTRLGGRWVVDGIDATPPDGHLTGLLGPNGAGKTTLLRLDRGPAAAREGRRAGRRPRRSTTCRARAARSGSPCSSRSRRARSPSRSARSSSLGRIPYRTLWGSRSRRRARSTAPWSARRRTTSPTAPGPPCPAASGSACRSPARSRRSPTCCCSTSRPTTSTSARSSACSRSSGTWARRRVAALHDLNLAAAFCEHVLVLVRRAPRRRRATRATCCGPTCCARSTASRPTSSTHPRTGRPVIAFHEPSRETPMKITVLSGGVGGARFTRGLRELARRRDHGDRQHRRRHVAARRAGVPRPRHPDVHARRRGARGPGLGPARRVPARERRPAAYGLGWEWFTLGDLDLATHLARTELLRARAAALGGHRAAGRALAAGRHAAADDRRRGRDARASSRTAATIHFEEWWVRHRAALPARRFVQTNLETARPAPGVLDAIADADVVVIPPSNPVVSVGTILAIPGVRDALRTTAAPVVGVSPVIGGAPVRGMADACLAAIGVETTALAVARALRPAARRDPRRVARRRARRRRGPGAAGRGARRRARSTRS